MATLITDPNIEERLIAERRDQGIDLYDEVWDGVYIMAPMANNEHQFIVIRIAGILDQVIGLPGLGEVLAGVNVSDREDDWTQNYRIPDVAVFLNGTSARNCDEFWLGGPDFAVEITSPHDKTYDKLPFYAQVGVRELLIINRQSWQLELYRPATDGVSPVATLKAGDETPLVASTVGLSFKLIPASLRPQIEISTVAGDSPRNWRA